jgi:hypothetical protein
VNSFPENEWNNRHKIQDTNCFVSEEECYFLTALLFSDQTQIMQVRLS